MPAGSHTRSFQSPYKPISFELVGRVTHAPLLVDEQASGSARPVKTFKQGCVEVSVWRNLGEQGDMYNATIRKSYKDE